MAEPLRLATNPALEISGLDSDAAEPMVLCQVPAQDGVLRLAVPSVLAEFVEQFDGRRSVDEAIAGFERLHPGRHSAARLRLLVSDFLLPKGLLVEPGKAAAVAQRKPDHRRSFLYIKLPILKPRLVEPIARAFRWAFRWPVLAVWLPLFVALHVLFYGSLLPLHDLDVNQIRAGDILLLMLLTTIGTFVHELGHASAAASYGCRGIEVGWGLYLVFTVLYTDVSEAWKLPRRQRAVVDLGGIYFQSVFLAVLVGLFFLTGDSIYLLTFFLMDLSLASSLNPFLRLDGYWLVSDYFGIINLRQQSVELLRRVGGKLLGRTAEPLPWTRKIRWTLGVYAVFSVAFFVFLTVVLFERIVLRIAEGLPVLLADYWLTLTLDGMTPGQLGAAGFEILWRGMMVLGFGFLLFNLCKKLIALGGGLRRWRVQRRRRTDAVADVA